MAAARPSPAPASPTSPPPWLASRGVREILRERVQQEYPRSGPLGHGAHAQVARAKSTASSADVALKMVDIGEDENARSAAHEIDALRLVRDDHVVRLQDALYCSPVVYLVLDFAPTALDRLLRERPLDADEARRFTRGLFKGLAACHEARILHCDVKPANLLVDASGELLVADFGLAHGFDEPFTGLRRYFGTLPYRPPEFLMECGSFRTFVDVWSAGVVVMEMASRKPPAVGTSELDQLLRLFALLGSPSPAEWQALYGAPLWSPLLPTFSPKPTTFDDARAMGLEEIARNSFVLVPWKRWSAARLAEAASEQQEKRARRDA